MRIISCLFVLLITSSFAPPVKDLKLAYTFKIGDHYEMTQLSNQAIKQDIPGMGEMKIDIVLEGIMQFKVAELTKTGAKIETTFSKIKMVTKSPMGDMTMDSGAPGEDVQSKMLKVMVNKPFFMYMSKQGAIEKIENVENLYADIASLGLDSAAQDAAKQSLQQVMGETSLKASLEKAFPYYPATNIKEGSTWNSNAGVAMNFPMKISNTWKINSVEGNKVSLEGDGTLVTTDKDKITPINGMKAKADLSGRQAIKSSVDLKTGWPTELKEISEMKGNMTLLAGGMIPEDMIVPMEVVSESTFTTVKK